MNMEYQAQQYLDATDNSKWLTYEDYVRDVLADKQIPITPNQWDVLVSTAGKRHLQDRGVVDQIIQNMRMAAKDIKTPMKHPLNNEV